MNPSVTVVGLGPAGEDLVGTAAREAIASADAAFLRTSRHPAASAFAGVPSFDHHYEDAASFDEVYDRIVADLVTTAQALATDGRRVVYAVPGSPLVAERTVELLRDDPRVEVTVVPAMSFLDLAWARLGVDPLAQSVRLVDGTRFAEQAAGERGPLLVAQCWSQGVLSEVKLAVPLAEPSSTVTVLHHLGLPDELVATVPWDDLDRALAPDHLTSLWIPQLAAPVASELVQLDELVRRLRRDCPWDRQQTHASLRRHLLEESYEVLDAIDELAHAGAGDAAGPTRGSEAERGVSADEAAAVAHLEEELGDLLFQVYFHARLAAEEGRFNLADVARGLHAKLVARHPHVFGDVQAGDAATVVANWERMKQTEKGRRSVTDGMPLALPALSLPAKLQRKASAVPEVAPPDPEALHRAIQAHLGALDACHRDGGAPGEGGATTGASSREGSGEGGSAPPSVAAEAAGLLWAVCDLVRRCGVEPEDALRTAAMRFRDEVRAAESADAG